MDASLKTKKAGEPGERTRKGQEPDAGAIIKTVAIIGAGQMGNGIAHVVSLAGYNVLMSDLKKEAEGLLRPLAECALKSYLANNWGQELEFILDEEDLDGILTDLASATSVDTVALFLEKVAAPIILEHKKEEIAVKEANKLGIPVVAVIDSNCDPDEVTYPIPGNDDAARAIQLYCDLIADSVLDGLTESQVRGGADIGASVAPPREAALAAVERAREREHVPVESPIDGPTGANY